MIQIKIESGFAPPSDKETRPPRRSILELMEVGHSIVVPIDLRSNWMVAGWRLGEGRKFTSRKISQDSVRIWRIA